MQRSQSWIYQNIKKNHTQWTNKQVVLIPGLQGWFNTQKSISIRHCSNTRKNKIIWLCQEMKRKLLTMHNTRLKLSIKWRQNETSSIQLKSIYDKPIESILLNGEKLKSFPLKTCTSHTLTTITQCSVRSPAHSN